MFTKLLSFGTSIPPKKLFAITLLNSSLLAWYFFLAQVNFEIIFSGFSSSNSLIFTGKAIFYFVGAISAMISSTRTGLPSSYERRAARAAAKAR